MMSCGNGQKKNDAVSVELPIAVQLYSVRGDMEADFVGTLAKIKNMGFDGVEFAGLFGNCPKQVKHWCDSLGLDAVAAHVPLADMLADVDKVIADYKAIGCEYIVVPYVTAERRPKGELFMQMVEEIKGRVYLSTALTPTSAKSVTSPEMYSEALTMTPSTSHSRPP